MKKNEKVLKKKTENILKEKIPIKLHQISNFSFIKIKTRI